MKEKKESEYLWKDERKSILSDPLFFTNDVRLKDDCPDVIDCIVRVPDQKQ